MSHDTTNATDLSHLIDAPLSDCDHERFERNHYFHGKLMTARDMAAEQAYHAGQRRAHARSVAGSGVAWGLGASVRNDGDAVTVAVDRGYAIDGCGRAIVVPQDRETTVTDPDVVGADEVTVELVYESCLLESVPISGAESACEDECAYNRVLEAYRIEVSEGRPDEAAKPVPDVTFPAMDDYDRSGREQPASGDPELSTVATSYRNAEEATTGDPTAGSVFVGAFEAPDGDADGGEWSPLADAHPPSLVYTNDMLYAATARHVADFENPHQVTLTTATPDDGDGAAVRVLDDESDDPDVTVASADGSVDVTAAADQHVDLSVESYVEEHVETVLEERLEPLERYTIQQALQYTALVFAHAAERFDDAADAAEAVARLARGASDGRLVAESDAVAAEELEILDEDWEVAEELDGDVYRQLVERLDELADEFAEDVEESVTSASHKRLVVALERLQAAVDAEERPTDPLPLASAQDDVADAVEWLEPVDGDGDLEKATFGASVYEVNRGDLVEFDVHLEGTDTARLDVGSPGVGYLSHVTIEADQPGDTVTVRMNTYLAGRAHEARGEDDVFAAVDDAHSVSATLSDDVDERPGLLEAGGYDLALSVGDTQTDTAALRITARSTDELTTWVGPDAIYDDLDSPDAFDEARADGALVDDEKATRNDVIVAAVAVNGIFGAIADASGDPTDVTVDGFRHLEEGEIFDMDMTRTDPGPVFLDVWSSVDEDGAKFLLDDREGRLFMVLDVDELEWTAFGDVGSTPPPGPYDVTFQVSGNSLLAEVDETVVGTTAIIGPPDIEVATIPDVIGMHVREAHEELSGAGLETAFADEEVQTVDQLRNTGYDHVLDQSIEPGSELDAGETVELLVLVSRQVEELDGIAEGRAQELAALNIEWVHELRQADAEAVAANTSFGLEQVLRWQELAEQFLKQLHASFRFGLEAELAGRVVDAFEGVDNQAVLEMDEATVESMIAEATNNEVIAPADAQDFLSSGTGLTFDATNFEIDFDDVDFDPTG